MPYGGQGRVDGEGEYLAGGEAGVSGQTPENMQEPSVTTVSQSGCREEEKLPPGRYLLIPPRAKCLMPGSKKGIKGFHPTYWWGKEKKLV